MIGHLLPRVALSHWSKQVFPVWTKRGICFHWSIRLFCYLLFVFVLSVFDPQYYGKGHLWPGTQFFFHCFKPSGHNSSITSWHELNHQWNAPIQQGHSSSITRTRLQSSVNHQMDGQRAKWWTFDQEWYLTWKQPTHLSEWVDDETNSKHMGWSVDIITNIIITIKG